MLLREWTEAESRGKSRSDSSQGWIMFPQISLGSNSEDIYQVSENNVTF